MLTSAKCYFCDNGADTLYVNGENAVFCNNCERKAGVNGGKRRFCKKGDSMRGYKAFNCDLTCRGFQYEIGETYTLDDPDSLEICKSGFHFCPNIASCYKYYDAKDTTRICEVEALGEIQESDEGDKMVTDKIKIIREITGPEKRGNLTEQDGYCNTGESNTGNWNTGDFNTGRKNTGNKNTGNWNIGNSNSGDRNTGYDNAGDWNSGNRNAGNNNTGYNNAGDWNTGNWNVGDCNTGDFNYGSCNSGSYNDGDRNSGDRNFGCKNSGDYNSGNWNSGCFNTHANPTISMFNKQSDWTMEDWVWSDARAIILDLFREEEKKQDLWEKLDREYKAIVMSLPNFDADIFEECTGIRVGVPDKSCEKTNKSHG